MWDKKIIAISDKSACKGDFLKRVERLARANIGAFILREKEMRENDYYDLAKEVLTICKKHKLMCFLHTFDKVALKLGHRYFHCPLKILRAEPRLVKYFITIGTSVHSSDELLEAMNFGCNYAIFGHIFETLSKPFTPPKGVEQLKELCKLSTIPIYAVGGINENNVEQLANVGVAGVCMKSALMQNSKLKDYVRNCAKKLNQ